MERGNCVSLGAMGGPRVYRKQVIFRESRSGYSKNLKLPHTYYDADRLGGIGRTVANNLGYTYCLDNIRSLTTHVFS